MPTKKIQKKAPYAQQKQSQKIKGVIATQQNRKKGVKAQGNKKQQANKGEEFQYKIYEFYDPQNEKMKKLAPVTYSMLKEQNSKQKKEDKIIYTALMTYFPDIPKNGDNTVLGNFDDLKQAQLCLFKNMHGKIQEMEESGDIDKDKLIQLMGNNDQNYLEKHSQPYPVNGCYSKNYMMHFNWLYVQYDGDCQNYLWQIQAAYLNKI